MKGEGVPQGALVNIDGTGTLHEKWSGGKGDSARRVGKYRRYRQSHGSGMGVLFCVAKKVVSDYPRASYFKFE